MCLSGGVVVVVGGVVVVTGIYDGLRVTGTFSGRYSNGGACSGGRCIGGAVGTVGIVGIAPT
jgi:hypothetical protein